MAAARERAAHVGSGKGFAPEAQILPRAVVLRVRRVRHGAPRRLHAKGGDAICARRGGDIQRRAPLDRDVGHRVVTTREDADIETFHLRSVNEPSVQKNSAQRARADLTEKTHAPEVVPELVNGPARARHGLEPCMPQSKIGTRRDPHEYPLQNRPARLSLLAKPVDRPPPPGPRFGSVSFLLCKWPF